MFDSRQGLKNCFLFFHSYPRRREVQTICRYQNKDSIFSSIIIRPCDNRNPTQIGNRTRASRTVDWPLTNQANKAAVKHKTDVSSFSPWSEHAIVHLNFNERLKLKCQLCALPTKIIKIFNIFHFVTIVAKPKNSKLFTLWVLLIPTG